MLDYNALVAKATADHERFKGKLLLCECAAVAEDDNDPNDRDFDPPLICRVVDAPLESHHVMEYEEEGGLIDVTWDVEVLPGQLEEWEHVYWVPGPTYYADGRVEYGPWELDSGEGS